MNNMQPREIVAAFIAAILVLSYCLAVLFDIVNGKAYNVPDAFLALVVSATGYYLGQHASTNGAYTAGVSAAQTAAATITAQNATTNK